MHEKPVLTLGEKETLIKGLYSPAADIRLLGSLANDVSSCPLGVPALRPSSCFLRRHTPSL